MVQLLRFNRILSLKQLPFQDFSISNKITKWQQLLRYWASEIILVYR